MINHRNDVKMCKTQMEPLATGKWLKIVFHFFTITLTVLRSFPEKFLGQSGPGLKRKTNFSIITSFACFVIDYSSSPISLPRSRFLGGALRDIQKTAARETIHQSERGKNALLL